MMTRRICLSPREGRQTEQIDQRNNQELGQDASALPVGGGSGKAQLVRFAGWATTGWNLLVTFRLW